MKRKKKTSQLSLSPLKFREAVSDLLKVKPEPKSKNKAKKRKKPTLV
jgi:hypothetical protein